MPRPGSTVSSKPASGTSRASMPRSLPTSSTDARRWPRSTSARAMAMAGWTWPAVPPPATRAKQRRAWRPTGRGLIARAPAAGARGRVVAWRATDSSSPAAAMPNTSDEPPALTKAAARR